MKRIIIILGILLAALMLVVACAPKEVEKAPAKKEAPKKEAVKEEVKKEEVKKEEIKEEVKEPGADTTAEEDITAVDKEVTEIGDITEDLNLNDLEELDKELQELENLEI